MLVYIIIMTEFKTILCESCEYYGISINAHVWCNDCNGGLCEECVKGHETTKLLRQHLIISIEDYLHADNIPNNQMCLKHDKTLEKYCCPHDAVLCVKCVQQDHRFCEKLIGFNEAVKYSENSPALLNLEEQIMTAMRQIDFVIDFQKLNKENLKEQEEKIRQEIKETRDSIISRIDYLHLQLCDDLKATFEKARSVCDMSKTRLEEIKNRMCQFQQEITNLKKTTSEKYIFIRRKLIEKDTLTMTNTIKQDISNATPYKACFQMNPYFKSKYLNKMGFISLHLDTSSSIILDPDTKHTVVPNSDIKCKSLTETGLERKSLTEPESEPDWKQTPFQKPNLEQTSFNKPDLRQTFFKQSELKKKSSFERIHIGRKHRIGVKPMFKSVNITSGVILQNNKIVLAERNYKGLIEIILNDSFTMFDGGKSSPNAQQYFSFYMHLKKEVFLDDSCIGWIPLTFTPRFVTAIEDDTVVISYDNRDIGTVDINTREVKTISGLVRDLAKFVYGDGKFYAIDNYRREITEFDMKFSFSSAQKVVSAQNKRNIEEIAFFDHRIVYCTSERSDNIDWGLTPFQADKKMQMHCCNPTGELLWTVKLDLIEKPFSDIPMTLDNQGNVFVAGHDVLYFVSADGKHSKVLLDESGQKTVTSGRLFYEKNANLLISNHDNISFDIFMVRR